MLISIFIWFYFSFKLILTEKLNENNLFQLQNNENAKNLEKRFSLAMSVLSKGDTMSTDGIKETVIYILEQLRDNPVASRGLVDLLFQIINSQLKEISQQNNMKLLYNFTEEIFGSESGLKSDFKNVIINHTEFFNYTIILVNKVFDGKNIIADELFKYIYNIINIDGMDKVFAHILNSTYNGAIFELVGKLLNGTEYAELYDSLKDNILLPHKNQIIRLVYYILKSGLLWLKEDSAYTEIMVTTLKMIRSFIISIKPGIRIYLNQILNQTNLTNLYNLTADIFSENSTFIDELFDCIEKHPEFIPITMNLIKIGLDPNRTIYQIFSNLKKLFNIDGFRGVISKVLKKHFSKSFNYFQKQLITETQLFRFCLSLKTL